MITTLMKKAAALTLCLSATAAMAGQNPYLGEIVPMSNGYCPSGWAETNGQLLAIAENQALYAQIGPAFGGNGTTTFALPNLQARIPIHTGASQGVLYDVGMAAGAGTTAFSMQNLPSHSHSATSTASSTMNANDANTDVNSPAGAHMGVLPAGGADEYTADTNLNKEMVTGNVATTVSTTVLPTGAGQPVSTVSPFLVVRFCIALDGIWPPRS